MAKADEIKRCYVKNRDGVHLVNPFFDYTLCMDTLDGDTNFSVTEIQPMAVSASAIVTCEKCIKIIRLCQDVKYRE